MASNPNGPSEWLQEKGETWHLRGPRVLSGSFEPPSDKSLLHRAVLLGALAAGTSTLHHLSAGDDACRTLAAVEALGVRVERRAHTWWIHGVGRNGFRAPSSPIDCGNSGTTMRLLAGVLAGQSFETELVGDASLMRRPMLRVAEPLRAMGARVECLGVAGRPPLRIRGPESGVLRGMRHHLAVESAQVRSALLFAGLRATDPTRIEPASASRDHTQRMLRALGVAVEDDSLGTTLVPSVPVTGWRALEMTLPGDLSSAAFFIALAAVTPGSRLRVEHVGLNPGRARYLEILQTAGARLRMQVSGEVAGEPWGEVHVEGRHLTVLQLGGRDVVQCIDEIPALLAAAAAGGIAAEVRDAAELRVKESDRIASMAAILREFGCRVHEAHDALQLDESTALRPAQVDSGGDHRIAMAAAMLASCCTGESRVDNVGCVRTSYPGFAADLRRLT